MKKLIILGGLVLKLFADYFYVASPIGDIYTRKVYIDGNVVKIYSKDIIKSNVTPYLLKGGMDYIIFRYDFIQKIKSNRIFYMK